MSPGFSIGLLVTNDDIDAVIFEGWPGGVPKPRMVVFDYAGNDVLDEYVLRVSTGAPNAGLTGREVFAVEYGPDCRYPSPAEILSVLDARKPADKHSALSIARSGPSITPSRSATLARWPSSTRALSFSRESYRLRISAAISIPQTTISSRETR